MSLTVTLLFPTGGPGCKRNMIAEKLVVENPGVVHLSVGDLLRQNIMVNAGNSRWESLREVVNSGKLADMVRGLASWFFCKGSWMSKFD